MSLLGLKRSIYVTLGGMTCAAALISCSSGGGSTLTPPPPAPAVNAPPVIRVLASASSAEEGSSVTLDASTTSDTDGDALTFSWKQTAGPTAVLNPDTSASIVTVTAPSVIEDATLGFELSVFDGTATSTSAVSIEVKNITLSPTYDNQSRQTANTLEVSKSPKLFWDGHVGFETDTGQIEFKRIELDPVFELAEPEGFHAQMFPADARFYEAVRRPFEFDVMNPYPINVDYRIDDSLVVRPMDNTVTVLTRERDTTAETVSVLDVPSPCAADILIKYSLPASTFSHDFDPLGIHGIIASRAAGGFSIFEAVVTGDVRTHNELTVIGNPDRIYCDILATNRYIDSYYVRRPGPDVRTGTIFSDEGNLILAVDRMEKVVSLFEAEKPAGSNTVTLTELQTVPINLDTTEPIEFVDSAILSGEFGGDGRAGMALIFSDGEEFGTHRMVAIGVSKDDTISQTVKSWGRGVPIDVAQAGVHGRIPPPTAKFSSILGHEIVVLPDKLDNLIVFRQAAYRGFSQLQSRDDPARLPIEDAAYLEIDGGIADQLTNYSIRSYAPELLLARKEAKELESISFGYVDETPP